VDIVCRQTGISNLFKITNPDTNKSYLLTGNINPLQTGKRQMSDFIFILSDLLSRLSFKIYSKLPATLSVALKSGKTSDNVLRPHTPSLTMSMVLIDNKKVKMSAYFFQIVTHHNRMKRKFSSL
jgi:hypothetical protein